VNEHFRPFIDKSKSIVNLTDVWATKKKRHGEIHAESTRRVSDEWKEDDTTSWELSDRMKCGQSEGACVDPHPSLHVMTEISNGGSHKPVLVYCTAYTFAEHSTHVLTKKKARSAADFPFHKLSDAARRKVDRGWSRRATQEFKTSSSGGLEGLQVEEWWQEAVSNRHGYCFV
jgi:hypothetical protein